MNTIKQRLCDCLIGKVELSTVDLLHAQVVAPNIIQIGQEQDADAILHAVKFDGLIYVLLFAGRSLLQGQEMNAYLTRYFSDAKGFNFHLKKIVDYLYEDMRGGTTGIMVLRDMRKQCWRGFNPLLNIEQIYEAVT